jgi:hypothetical protein
MGRTIRYELAVHEYQTNGLQDWLDTIEHNKKEREQNTFSTSDSTIKDIISFVLSTDTSLSLSLTAVSKKRKDVLSDLTIITVPDDNDNGASKKKSKKNKSPKTTNAIDSIFDTVLETSQKKKSKKSS